MMNTMQAIGFKRYGSADVLETLELPRPVVAPDDVLIRVVAASINPADWRFRSGQFRFAIRLKLPFIPGSDVAGVVEAVGSAVTRFQPGDAVYAMLPTTSGGGYAQFVAVAERNLTLMPRNLSFTEAAAVPLTALTALQALRDKADLQAGAHLLINGASGGVGTFAVQIAKAIGARVTATSSGRNTAVVREIGADEVIDYTQQDVTAGEPRYDVIFDAVNVLSFRRARRVLRPNGMLVTVNPLIGNLSPDWLARFRDGRKIRSVLVQPSGDDLRTLNEWIERGQVRPIIEQRFVLAEAAEAHRLSERGRVRGKLVLIVDERLAASRGGLPLQNMVAASKTQQEALVAH